MAFYASNICRAHTLQKSHIYWAMLQVILTVATYVCRHIENIHEKLANFVHPHSFPRGWGLKVEVSPLVTLTELIMVYVGAFNVFKIHFTQEFLLFLKHIFVKYYKYILVRPMLTRLLVHIYKYISCVLLIEHCHLIAQTSLLTSNGFLFHSYSNFLNDNDSK